MILIFWFTLKQFFHLVSNGAGVNIFSLTCMLIPLRTFNGHKSKFAGNDLRIFCIVILKFQVRKFASINLDESPKNKKPQKRPGSPQNKQPVLVPNPVSHQGAGRVYPKVIPMPVSIQAPKKMKV